MISKQRKGMHIVHVTDGSHLSGGLFYSVRHPAKIMAAQGNQVSVVSPESRTLSVDQREWDGVDFYSYAGLGPIKYNLRLSRIIERLNPDVIHVHGVWEWGLIAAAGASRRKGTPMVVSPRGMLDEWALSRSGLKKRVALAVGFKRALKQAAAIHCLNASEEESVRRLDLGPRLHVIPNGAFEAARCTNFKERQKTIVFMSRIHEKKGLDLLAEAWSSLRANDWTLALAGWGDPEYIERLRGKFGPRADSVEWHGRLEGASKEALLSSARYMILPSYSEGMPMAVLDALSFGTPCIVSAHCNMALAAEVGAVTVSALDVTSLRDAIEIAMARQEREWVSMSEAGTKLIHDHYTWEAIAVKFIWMYNSLI